MRSTYITKPSDVDRKWYVIDAENQTLGRLATQVAVLLRGKHKPIYSPFIDAGDHVIIINAEKINVTGKKLDQKIYVTHSGWIGGRKEVTLRTMLDKKPDKVLYEAVKGMLPKNTLGRDMLKKLRVYAGSEHDHQAQKPEAYEIKSTIK